MLSSSSDLKEKSKESQFQDMNDQVRKVLTLEANKYAIQKIDYYLKEKLESYEKDFLEKLKNEINQSGDSFVGGERLHKLIDKLSAPIREKIFNESFLFGYSKAAICIFDLFRIYSLNPMLDQKISEKVIVADPRFQEMCKNKGSSYQSIFEKDELRSLKSIQQQSAKLLDSKTELKDIVQTAQKKMYWQPTLFLSQTNIESKQLILQQKLVCACETGNLTEVKGLLALKAKVDLADPSGKLPFAAAVWGMNADIVDCLLSHAQQKNEKIMSWEDCETHNISRYGNVFLLPDQFLQNEAKASDDFLNTLSASPFLRDLLLKDKQSSLTWEKWRTSITRKSGYATAGTTMREFPLSVNLIKTYNALTTRIKEKALPKPKVSFGLELG